MQPEATALHDPGEKAKEIARIREDVLRCLNSGRLRIPSLPDIALRVRQAVNDPDKGLADVARIVQVDPALAARLVHIANSPLYRGEHPIDSCHLAVTRLGLNATRNFVVGFTLRNLFRPKRRALLARLHEIWRHGCRVGAISAVLARVTPGVDADRVILAGLVHGIGALPVLDYLDRSDIREQELVDALLESLAPELGCRMLRDWGFDEELADVPVAILRFERFDPDAPEQVARCADLVQVAWIHAGFGSQGKRRVPSLPELASFRRLPISRLGPDASLEVLEQSREEIRELAQLLTG